MNKALEKIKNLPFAQAKKEIGKVIRTEDAEDQMTNEKINDFLHSNASISNINRLHDGAWQFHFEGTPAYIMTDNRQGVDRMRIMAKITDNPAREKIASPERLLQANCHEALDARFCFEQDGSLWSAFIHRLSTLDPIDLDSGLKQVTHLAKGYPMRLSSLDIVFVGGRTEY